MHTSPVNNIEKSTRTSDIYIWENGAANYNAAMLIAFSIEKTYFYWKLYLLVSLQQDVIKQYLTFEIEEYLQFLNYKKVKSLTHWCAFNINLIRYHQEWNSFANHWNPIKNIDCYGCSPRIWWEPNYTGTCSVLLHIKTQKNKKAGQLRMIIKPILHAWDTRIFHKTLQFV